MMGCGSSSHVTPMGEEDREMGGAGAQQGGVRPTANGKRGGEPSEGAHEALAADAVPDKPVLPKKPLAFDIPLSPTAASRAPPLPPRLQRRVREQSLPELTLPDIQEKLAEAEHRRRAILQQRAASASRRAQKAMKLFHGVEAFKPEDSSHDFQEATEKYVSTNTLKIPTENESWPEKQISRN